MKKIFSKGDVGKEEKDVFSGDKNIEKYVEKKIKERLDEIIKRAKKKSDEMEDEWRQPVVPDVEEIVYYIDGEEQEEVPVAKVNRKKPRPYMSYAEFVVNEVEKERKK